MTNILKLLKIGFGALTVRFYKFWALLYSGHGEMNLQGKQSYFLSHITHNY